MQKATQAKTTTSEVSLEEFNNAKRSINGRLSRLRTKGHRPRWWMDEDQVNDMKKDNASPIAAIGVFDDEIDRVERAYEAIQSRLNNAKITIEI